MDAEQLTLYIKKAQLGGRLRSLTQHYDWPAFQEVLLNIRAQYDTVIGIETDKEWIKRKAKVELIDELNGWIETTTKEAEYALEELRENQ